LTFVSLQQGKKWARKAGEREQDSDDDVKTYKVSVPLGMWELDQTDARRDTGQSMGCTCAMCHFASKQTHALFDCGVRWQDQSSGG
jgi:hypothetical protein